MKDVAIGAVLLSQSKEMKKARCVMWMCEKSSLGCVVIVEMQCGDISNGRSQCGHFVSPCCLVVWCCSGRVVWIFGYLVLWWFDCLVALLFCLIVGWLVTVEAVLQWRNEYVWCVMCDVWCVKKVVSAVVWEPIWCDHVSNSRWQCGQRGWFDIAVDWLILLVWFALSA